MKWFRHESDAHSNLKLQSVIEMFGMDGYGYYWACIELVAKEGTEFVIAKDKLWKNYLKRFTGIEIEKQNQYLDFFADLNLINKKALKIGHLSIPKLEERLDEYTAKVRSKSRQHRDNVGLQDNTEQDITTDIQEQERGFTPSQEAKDFFSNPDKQEEIIKGLVAKGFTEQWVRSEIKKFINHWTEKTKSGKFEKWEKKETFEVGRRLVTWFNNAAKWSKDQSFKHGERVAKI